MDAFIKYQLRYERDSCRRDESIENHIERIQTFEAVFYHYLRDRNFERDNLQKMLNSVQKILIQYGGTEIARIDKKLLEEMQKTLIDSGLKGTTVRRRMGIVRAVLHWAHRNEYIETVPLFPIVPNAEYARNVPPTADEVTAIYQAAPPHLRRVIILGFMCEMRVGPCELFQLSWNDIDIERKVIRVPNAKKGNTDPWREVPIKQSLLPLIQQWKREDAERKLEYVITYNGKPIRYICKSWKDALKRAEIKRHIRPYDLRHGFATEAIAAGADYGTVAALMGHKSPTMVLKHYQHVRNARKQSVMEAIPQPFIG